jgi:DUF177 domain-containing protein
MSAQTVIDSLEFARTEQILRGSLPVVSLQRLHDALYDTQGLVEFVVQGGQDARHRPVLNLEVSAVLHLTCQRCLGRLDHPLRLATTLLLASAADAAAAGLDKEDDEWIEPGAELDIASLIEDEIILALPYSSRHPEGECRLILDSSSQNEGRSAFAKLATLKRNSK